MLDQDQQALKAYFNQRCIRLHRWKLDMETKDLHFETNYQYGEMFLIVRIHSLLDVRLAGIPYVKHFNH